MELEQSIKADPSQSKMFDSQVDMKYAGADEEEFVEKQPEEADQDDRDESTEPEMDEALAELEQVQEDCPRHTCVQRHGSWTEKCRLALCR